MYYLNIHLNSSFTIIHHILTHKNALSINPRTSMSRSNWLIYFLHASINPMHVRHERPDYLIIPTVNAGSTNDNGTSYIIIHPLPLVHFHSHTSHTDCCTYYTISLNLLICIKCFPSSFIEFRNQTCIFEFLFLFILI